DLLHGYQTIYIGGGFSVERQQIVIVLTLLFNRTEQASLAYIVGSSYKRPIAENIVQFFDILGSCFRRLAYVLTLVYLPVHLQSERPCCARHKLPVARCPFMGSARLQSAFNKGNILKIVGDAMLFQNRLDNRKPVLRNSMQTVRFQIRIRKFFEVTLESFFNRCHILRKCLACEIQIGVISFFSFLLEC